MNWATTWGSSTNYTRYTTTKAAKADQGGVSPHPGYGYVNQRAFAPGAPGSICWSTIMTYGSRCGDEGLTIELVHRFSNPHQRHNGDPLGVPYGGGGPDPVTGPADATAVLNATGPAVALRRDRPSPAGANRPPVWVTGTLPDRTLMLDGTHVDVSQAFVDPDGDVLAYTVSSSAPQVVTVRLAGTRARLRAVGRGASTIRVTPTDPGGLSARQVFAVTVATPTPFTDDPLVPGMTPVRSVHFADADRRPAGSGGIGRIPVDGPGPDGRGDAGPARASAGAAGGAGRGLRGGWSGGAGLDGRGAGGRADPDPGGAPDGAARCGGGVGIGVPGSVPTGWGTDHEPSLPQSVRGCSGTRGLRAGAGRARAPPAPGSTATATMSESRPPRPAWRKIGVLGTSPAIVNVPSGRVTVRPRVSTDRSPAPGNALL